MSKNKPLKLSKETVEIPIDNKAYKTQKDAEHMVDTYRSVMKDNEAFVNVTYGIGVATENEKGYRPLNPTFWREYQNYNDRDDLVNRANEILHPDKTRGDIFKIILSSMR